MNGILNVNKERGFTSHDVVAKLRGILRMKKIGHTGTLDPDACGVLPVCLGQATKVCGLLTEQRKTYEAVLLLGRETDTQDAGGRSLCEKPVEVTPAQAEEALASFVGTRQQIPPMYSALKVNGKRLYELAREGKTVERKPRLATFFEITVLSIEIPRVRFRVACSKGTYIRTLCHDVGQALGCGGCMEALVRTRVGPFGLEDSLTLGQIEALCREGKAESALHPVDSLFADWPPRQIGAGYEKYMYNGNALKAGWLEGGRRPEEEGLKAQEPPSRIRLYTGQGEFFGLYEYQAKTACYRLKKMFYGG